ncbi:hypothetical protein GQ37_003925 [Janthinobacterium sp. BJB1]|nr:hypothetical protein GQ37_003925 [Janthinobacterium sp. BJB1]
MWLVVAKLRVVAVLSVAQLQHKEPRVHALLHYGRQARSKGLSGAALLPCDFAGFLRACHGVTQNFQYGITGSFVNTFKRDYASLKDRNSAEIFLAQLPDATMHFNEVHPHSALKQKLPRLFRRELARRAQESGAS